MCSSWMVAVDSWGFGWLLVGSFGQALVEGFLLTAIEYELKLGSGRQAGIHTQDAIETSLRFLEHGGRPICLVNTDPMLVPLSGPQEIQTSE